MYSYNYNRIDKTKYGTIFVLSEDKKMTNELKEDFEKAGKKRAESIDDKAECIDREVKEQEFALYLNNVLKQYEAQIAKYQQAILQVQKQEQDIVEIFKDVGMYKGLNFKVTYWFNEKKQEYSYKYAPRETIGFKTK